MKRSGARAHLKGMMRTFYLIVTVLLTLALGLLEVVAARNVPPAEPPPAATMEYAR